MTKIRTTVFSGVTVYNSIILQCFWLDVANMLKNENVTIKKYRGLIKVQAVTAKGHKQSLYSPITNYVKKFFREIQLCPPYLDNGCDPGLYKLRCTAVVGRKLSCSLWNWNRHNHLWQAASKTGMSC